MALVRESSLDEMYVHINSLFYGRNRRTEGGLDRALLRALAEHGSAILASSHKRHITTSSAEAVRDHGLRSLAWLFTAAGQVGFSSVEDLIWDKYPYACPYCLQCPHVDGNCKDPARPSKSVPVDWAALAQTRAQHETSRPHSIVEWLTMFDTIYGDGQLDLEDTIRNAARRFLEEGFELATAVRVDGTSQNQEWADCIAWIVKILVRNEQRAEGGRSDPYSRARAIDSLADELLKKYVACPDCNSSPCRCTSTTDAVMQRAMIDLAPPLDYVSARRNITKASAFFRFGSISLEIDDQRYDLSAGDVADIDRFLQEIQLQLEIVQSEEPSDDLDELIDLLSAANRGEAPMIKALEAVERWKAGNTYRLAAIVLKAAATKAAVDRLGVVAAALGSAFSQ
jgi:hypothetical protein